MKRIFPLFFLGVVSLSNPAKAQDKLVINRSLQDFASKMRFVSNSPGSGNSSFQNNSIEGSEYLNENFVKGDLLTQNSESFTDIPMRYNAYSDNMEVKLPDSMIYCLSDPGLIFQVKMRKDVMIYTHYVSPMGERDGFLFVLYEGKCSLYRRNYKVFNEKIPSNGILNEVPAKIADKPKEYYIRLNDTPPVIILSKKDLLLVLRDHSDELEKYLKKEKIRLNQEEDLIKVITYYDSLIK
jgi:hypothetical protein